MKVREGEKGRVLGSPSQT